MRTTFGVDLAFMLMNSFATSADTLNHLSKYPELPVGTGSPAEATFLPPACTSPAPPIPTTNQEHLQSTCRSPHRRPPPPCLHLPHYHHTPLAHSRMPTSPHTRHAYAPKRGEKLLPLHASGLPLEFVQNKAPKVTASDLSPASWPDKTEHEWCPPGHGDLYPAMVGSGTLKTLLSKGFK